jgi:hypothetical protein
MKRYRKINPPERNGNDETLKNLLLSTNKKIQSCTYIVHVMAMQKIRTSAGFKLVSFMNTTLKNEIHYILSAMVRTASANTGGNVWRSFNQARPTHNACIHFTVALSTELTVLWYTASHISLFNFFLEPRNTIVRKVLTLESCRLNWIRSVKLKFWRNHEPSFTLCVLH